MRRGNFDEETDGVFAVGSPACAVAKIGVAKAGGEAGLEKSPELDSDERVKHRDMRHPSFGVTVVLPPDGLDRPPDRVRRNQDDCSGMRFDGMTPANRWWIYATCYISCPALPEQPFQPTSSRPHDPRNATCVFLYLLTG